MGLLSELSSAYSPKKVHLHLLYCLLGIQFTYIIVDHFVYHYANDPLLAGVCNGPYSLSSSAATRHIRVQARRERKPKLCARREDFYDDGDAGKGAPSIRMQAKKTDTGTDGQARNRKGIGGLPLIADVNAEDHADHTEGYRESKAHPDAWHQMKWVGKPASCPVKGKLIERLDDERNFRRGYALQFVENVEDKTHLLPWLLASKVDLNRRRRRVYIDLGANRFTTSVHWFLRMYPCDFTEVHAFEVNPRSWRPPKAGFSEEGNRLARISNNSLLVRKKPGIPKWMLDRIHIHYKLASHRDDKKRGLVNMTRFIKEELKLSREDAVVVKVDIEGSEWPLLQAWMEDAEMPAIVDELFVEVHYAHPSMRAFGWDSFAPITRQDAKNLLADLRWRGFYAHAWP